MPITALRYEFSVTWRAALSLGSVASSLAGLEHGPTISLTGHARQRIKLRFLVIIVTASNARIVSARCPYIVPFERILQLIEENRLIPVTLAQRGRRPRAQNDEPFE
jgi:hypothetical protein